MEPELLPSSWPATVHFLIGLVGVMGIVYLLIATVNQARKLFGRRPPMDEQVALLDKDLRREMKAGDKEVERQVASLRVDMNSQFEDLSLARKDHQIVIERSFEKLSDKLDEQTEILRVAADRRVEVTNDKITELKVTIGKIDERTKKL